MWICSLRHPPFNAHAPYCHLPPVWLYNIFPYYLIKARFKKKKVIEHKMCVLTFSITFVRNISHLKS